MDFQEMWETVDSRVDWFLSGILLLLVLNILVPLYIGWVYMNQKPFHAEYNIQQSDIFVQKAKKLDDLPTMAEIKIETKSGQKPLPREFERLKTTNMLLPAGAREIGTLTKIADTTVKGGTGSQQVKTRQEPPVTGFDIVGRITGKGDLKASVIRKISTNGQGGEGAAQKGGNTFIAREGDYLANTDVRVVDINDTSIRLDQPGHRVTTFQFEIDKISERIRQSITLQ